MRYGLIPLCGRWYLDTNDPVISVNDGADADAYWIRLDEMHSAEDVLGWIHHMAEKEGSMSSADIGDLVRSLQFLNLTRVGNDGAPKTIENAELVAVKAVQGKVLPCEVADVEARAGVGEFGGTNLAEYARAERTVLDERRRAGRYQLGSRGRQLTRT